MKKIFIPGMLAGRALAGTDTSEDVAKATVASKVIETTNSGALTTLRFGELSPSG